MYWKNLLYLASWFSLACFMVFRFSYDVTHYLPTISDTKEMSYFAIVKHVTVLSQMDVILTTDWFSFFVFRITVEDDVWFPTLRITRNPPACSISSCNVYI